jgi:lactoylglutathione lyase
MFSKVDYIMVNVSDMTRSVAFYRDILGMSLKFESPGWSEFQTGATTLALHQIQARGGGEGRALAARGAAFVLAPTEQLNEGIRLAVCVDPDGLAISFAEPLTREPPRRE